MISYLRGKIIYKSDPLKKARFVVVDISGIGYKVTMNQKIFEKIEQDNDVEIFTYQHVTENDLELLGFLSFQEVEFFTLLLSINGIGPKSAMNILERTSIKNIQQAVIVQSADQLASMSGIGKSVCEKIVAGLKSKIKEFSVTSDSTEIVEGDLAVIEALEALGFSAEKAREVLAEISPKIQDNEKRIKEALKILGKTPSG